MFGAKIHPLIEAYYMAHVLNNTTYTYYETRDCLAVYVNSSTLYYQYVIVIKNGSGFFLQVKNRFVDFVASKLKTKTNKINKRAVGIKNDDYTYIGVYDIPENTYKHLVELDNILKEMEEEDFVKEYVAEM